MTIYKAVAQADGTTKRVKMTAAEEAAHLAQIEADATPPTPHAVTPLQMRKALRAAGLRPQVDAYVAKLDEEAREAWEYCIEVRGDDPFIEAAADALGMTQEQRDDLFRLAGKL